MNMENELSKKQEFDVIVNDFCAFVKNECTHPVTGVFYEKTACELLENIKSVIAQNQNSITVLSNKELMVVVGRFIGRNDFLTDKGEFNTKCVFAFAKDEYGVDLLGSIPTMFRGAVINALGI